MVFCRRQLHGRDHRLRFKSAFTLHLLLHKGNYWFRPVGRTPQFCPSLRPNPRLLHWGPTLGSWLRNLLRHLSDRAPPSRWPARPRPRCHIFHHSSAPAPPRPVFLQTQRGLHQGDRKKRLYGVLQLHLISKIVTVWCRMVRARHTHRRIWHRRNEQLRRWETHPATPLVSIRPWWKK